MTLASQLSGEAAPPASRDRAPGSRTAQRLRLAATSVVLVVIAFQQQPGRIVPDTKLDLTANPAGLMARALHLWDPMGFFGQVQNQGYGYLFPMGPFFALGHWAGLPEWIVQRAWWSVLLVAAFLGTVRLAAVLGIGTPNTRLLGGLVYALSPRMVSTLGPVSAEVLPMAVAPWIVVPLVRASVTGSVRRAAARSGVAVLLAGGVNAAAAVAVLPLPALYLLTRARGRRRAALLRWWSGSVVLATLWWVVPLVLLGRYSPPFLDWIENASVTTANTSLVETLRGTSQWLGFLTDSSGPVWPAGWLLVTTPALILDTVVLAVVGLFGLARKDLPERTVLVLGLLFGVLAVTFGHAGPLASPFAGWESSLLDGVLAPFRNVHKFDPLLRLPLTLGAVHTLGLLAGSWSGGRRRRWLPRPAVAGLIGLVVVALAGSAAPALTGRLAPRGSYLSLPGYWSDVATWLAARGEPGRALVVPGASFAEFYWGATRDEPLQALASTSWGVRDAVPLAPAGTIRMLDAVQRRLATGTPSAGLAPYLEQAGVGFLIVRNDLDYAAAQAPRPILVHQALDESPGLRRVAWFGSAVGGGSTPNTLVDQGLDVRYPAVEIYQVGDTSSLLQAVPLQDAVRLNAAPEALLDLYDSGVATGRPALLGPVDSASGDGPILVAEGLRRREVNFGRVDDNASATLTLKDPLRLHGTVRDYLPTPAPGGSSAVTPGVTIAASSSASDADNPGGTRVDESPFAAFDGLLGTQWASSGLGGAVGQWIEVTADHSFGLTGAAAVLGTDAFDTQPARVRVTTDRGSADVAVGPLSQAVALPARLGPTRRLRLTLEATSTGGPGFSFVVREVTVPQLTVARTVTVPPVPAGDAVSAVVLTAAGGQVDGCPRSGGVPRCAMDLARPGEEAAGIDRTVSLGAAALFKVTATVLPRPGPALDALVDRGLSGLRVTASSTASLDPVARPQAVADRLMSTGWVAADDDRVPALHLSWGTPRSVSEIRFLVDPSLAASRPDRVRIRAAGQVRTATLDRYGLVTLDPPIVTDELTVEFTQVRPVESYDPYGRQLRFLPVGVSEIVVTGADDLREPQPADTPVVLPCGSTPSLQVAGRAVRTEARTTLGDLTALRPVRLAPCTETAVPVPAGPSRVRLLSDRTWTAQSVVLEAADPVPERASAVSVRAVSWGVVDRTVEVGARAEPTLLVVHENENAGWRATLEGVALRSVTVDGWQQGWVLPPGPVGTVQLRYQPDGPYRAGLMVGLLAALALLGLAVAPARGRGTDGDGGPGSVGYWAAAALAGAVLLLVGGVAGLLVALTVTVVTRSGSRGPWRPWVAAGGMAVAGLMLARAPWNSFGPYAGNSGWTQLASLVALAAVAAPCARDLARDQAPVPTQRSLEGEPAQQGDQEGD